MDELSVIRINDINSFKAIKEDWDHLYELDSNANIDISWFWVFNSFQISPHKWTVIGVRNNSNSRFVAFLPLNIYRRGKFGVYPISQILYAGKPQSTYPAFLCALDFEFSAIRLMAEYIIKNLNWDILHFNWTKDYRINNFVNAFPDADFAVDINKSLTSLCLKLPDNHHDYLYNCISKSTRKRIRQGLKRINENEVYDLRYSNENTIDDDINAICELWFKRWKLKELSEWHRNNLIRYNEHNLLRLSMIWHHEKPVGGLACLLDPVKKVYKAYITSFNREYASLSPGIALFGESIKQAIEEKYQYYDFTVGLDPYKRAFGPDLYETKNISIKRKRIKTTVVLSVAQMVKKYAI